MPVLMHGIMDLGIDIQSKRFNQSNIYQSEFIALSILENSLQHVEKKKVLRSKNLYKSGNDYSTKFWEQHNIPVRTAEEKTLLNRLIENTTPSRK